MHEALHVILAILWLVGVIGFFALIVYQFGARSQERTERKREAIAQFEAWQSTAGAAQLTLGSGQCEVVQESETVGRSRSGPIYSYTFTMFLRNPSGEYFMFKSTSTGPYVKAVSPEVARAVLKEKFVDPRSA